MRLMATCPGPLLLRTPVKGGRSALVVGYRIIDADQWIPFPILSFFFSRSA